MRTARDTVAVVTEEDTTDLTSPDRTTRDTMTEDHHDTMTDDTMIEGMTTVGTTGDMTTDVMTDTTIDPDTMMLEAHLAVTGTTAETSDHDTTSALDTKLELDQPLFRFAFGPFDHAISVPFVLISL